MFGSSGSVKSEFFNKRGYSSKTDALEGEMEGWRKEKPIAILEEWSKLKVSDTPKQVGTNSRTRTHWILVIQEQEVVI